MLTDLSQIYVIIFIYIVIKKKYVKTGPAVLEWSANMHQKLSRYEYRIASFLRSIKESFFL